VPAAGTVRADALDSTAFADQVRVEPCSLAMAAPPLPRRAPSSARARPTYRRFTPTNRRTMAADRSGGGSRLSLHDPSSFSQLRVSRTLRLGRKSVKMQLNIEG
jgi:hypothetical protein